MGVDGFLVGEGDCFFVFPCHAYLFCIFVETLSCGCFVFILLALLLPPPLSLPPILSGTRREPSKWRGSF